MAVVGSSDIIEPTKAKQVEALLTCKRGLFPVRPQLVVCPNVSWGFFVGHEADLVVVNRSRYLTEIEIKVSASDWKNDRKKSKWGYSKDPTDSYMDFHLDPKIRSLWYAAPLSLAKRHEELGTPKFAGVVGVFWRSINGIYRADCQILRNAEVRKQSVKLTDEDVMTLSRLSSLRYWSMRQRESGKAPVKEKTYDD